MEVRLAQAAALISSLQAELASSQADRAREAYERRHPGSPHAHAAAGSFDHRLLPNGPMSPWAAGGGWALDDWQQFALPAVQLGSQ
eukprot:5481143-Prymnesium_polylepis.1